MKVAYGTAADVSAMTNQIADYPNIVGGTTTSTGTIGSVDFTPTVSGDYYFGFNAYSAANQFDLLVDDIAVNTTLATNQFGTNKFIVYPNPVKDILNISYDKNISSVKVYNLLGQEVIAKFLNSNQSQIDLSNLLEGTYLVKVLSEGLTQTIKILKQ